MLFIFSIPVFIRHLWQLYTVVFMHRCLICVVLLMNALANCSLLLITKVESFAGQMAEGLKGSIGLTKETLGKHLKEGSKLFFCYKKLIKSGKSAASLCRQAAARFQVMFCNNYLVKKSQNC